MVVKLNIPYETLIELVEQLPAEQQDDLLKRLSRRGEQPLTVADKLRLLNEVAVDVPINEAPSIRREDWYGDDGR